jgi:hypothetical protein
LNYKQTMQAQHLGAVRMAEESLNHSIWSQRRCGVEVLNGEDAATDKKNPSSLGVRVIRQTDRSRSLTMSCITRMSTSH